MMTSLYKNYCSYINYLDKKINSRRRGRTVKLFLAKILFTVIPLACRLFKKHSVEKCSVDFLFYFSCEANRDRFQGIITTLKSSGYTVSEDRRLSVLEAVKTGRIGAIPLSIPPKICIPYSEASYLKEVYDPKVVVLVDTRELLGSMLKRLYGQIVVNISHSLPEATWEFSNIDFSYFFFFGQSSIDRLKGYEGLFGDTKAVVVGSPFIYQSESRNSNRASDGAILFFGSSYPERVKDDLIFSRDIFIQYVYKNPEMQFIVRPHPLDNSGFWQECADKTQNLRISPIERYLDSEIEGVSLCLAAWSNGLLEATIMGCPVVAIDRTDMAKNYLQLGDYFPIAGSIEELSESILLVLRNYEEYTKRCAVYSRYHVSYPGKSQQIISAKLQEVFSGEVFIDEKITGCRWQLDPV